MATSPDSSLAEQHLEAFQDLEEQLLPGRIREYAGKVVLIKYGGNAMTDEGLKFRLLTAVAKLQAYGLKPVIVHGGGPAIQSLLDQAKIRSEFVAGHRKTTPESMRYVEMALSGEVNGDLVKHLNALGARAVGLTGKDAGMVTARKRMHMEQKGEKTLELDIGQVGDVDAVDPSLLTDLLEKSYLPIVAPVAVGESGGDFNINADMFAGHLAAALHVTEFILLTDVDGLMRDPADAASLIDDLPVQEVPPLMGSVIQGGMIPKVEAALIALRSGIPSARILNGKMPERLLLALLGEGAPGTCVHN